MIKINVLSDSQKFPKKCPVKKKCLCDILHIMLFWSRLFGIAPVTWHHTNNKTDFIEEDGHCMFTVSKYWMVYSVILAVGYNTLFYTSNQQNYKFDSSPEILYVVNESGYMVYATFLTIVACWRARYLVDGLNKTAPFLRRGLLCQSTKRSLLITSRFGIILILFQSILQISALAGLALSDSFASHNDIKDVIGAVVHNIPFMFYYQFCTICSCYIGIFMCFETAMQQTLTNGFLRPSEEDQSWSIIKFARCTGSHPNMIRSENKSGTLIEDLDCLRRLHEEIKQALIVANKAFNPQIVTHLFVELSVIIMHLYSIITYYYITKKTPDLYTLNFLDWLFLFLHTFAMALFLLSAQGIKMSQYGPGRQIIQYSSKHLTPAEYAEMRLFGLKLEYAPAQIFAGQFFAVDISLIAPIAGSVVTYLLVALQFRLYSSSEPSAITDEKVLEDKGIIF